MAFGNAFYRDGFLTDGFQLNINPSPWWWGRLFQDSLFKGEVINRWCNLRDSVLSDDSMTSTIDSFSFLLDEAQQRNFEKWTIMGQNIWPNYYVGESYEDEINYIKTWAVDRLHWLDDSLFCDHSYLITNAIELENTVTTIYPNPFSSNFEYKFILKTPGKISLSVYDINGTEVARILDGIYYSQGEHSIGWSFSKFPCTMYFIVLKLNGKIISRKRIVKV